LESRYLRGELETFLIEKSLSSIDALGISIVFVSIS
jgi:hypothetical protein